MKIRFYNEDTPEFKLDFNQVQYFLADLIRSENKKPDEISVIFCSDEYLLDINRKYLKHDYFTDIVTFDYCEKDKISGDIFISIDRVEENAREYRVDFYNELYRVIFHGVLHLTGYNDQSDFEKREMREKEDFYLNRFFKF
ncbi:MAG: rRNA maturation RNase YbeY [Prolixibacteraceae bacterium]|nr:rRNA maturation RNase YbeY [Prolixibacteraceae bacterium]MBN2775416.1 rRNA maturation RNase YbeY [Prolixibacteraceae bacterium]